MTTAYGLKWGIAVGLLTKLAAIVYNKKFTMDHAFMMIGYVIAAFMASILTGSLLFVGIISIIMTNIWIVFVSKFITGLSTYEIFMYGSSNFIFNAVLFIGFGDFFLGLMKFLT